MSTSRRPARTALGFHRWLLAKPAGAVVGVRCTVMRCPLATWLNDEMGGDGAEVGDAWRASRGDRLRPLPRWARRFVDLIDRRPAERSVTLEEADCAMATVLAERHGR